MNYFNKAILLAFVLCNSISLKAQTKINQSSYFHHPESVASDGKHYFISDVGKELDPLSKDGDGKIVKIDLSGKADKDSVFASGLDAPKGLVILKGVLYATDVDKIKGFDIADGKKVFELDFSSVGLKFLNDLEVKDDRTLFVSATDVNKIFEVHLGEKPSFEELAFSNPLVGPNGLAYDRKSNRLYVCGFGTFSNPGGLLGFLDLSATSKTFSQISERVGMYDGLTLIDNSLIVSDWVNFEQKGIILKVDIAKGRVETISTDLFAGPADFMINRKKEIIVPAMMEGNIFKVGIDKNL